MKPDDFQEALQGLSGLEFEGFVGNLLAVAGRFTLIVNEIGPRDRGIDFVALERILYRGRWKSGSSR